MNDETVDGRPGFLARLRARLVPRTPDFHAMLVDQCRLVVESTGQLLRLLRDADAGAGAAVRRLEHEGDRLKARNITALHHAFATPMDREDFYDAVTALDSVLNYGKSTVRELEILGIDADGHMVELASRLDTGARALLQAFEQLPRDLAEAERFGDQARRAERACEKAYRRALAELFDATLRSAELRRLRQEPGAEGAEDPLLVVVGGMLKRREIYRHLSNAADQIDTAARVLEDIVAKEG